MRIDNEFFKLDATIAAPNLVGKLICFRSDDGEVLRMRIIETECYMGEGDTACHASKGRTERNSTLWMEGGYSYVYLCYGMYQMFNVITGCEGDPQGVLIRGVEPFSASCAATTAMRPWPLERCPESITNTLSKDFEASRAGWYPLCSILDEIEMWTTLFACASCIEKNSSASLMVGP